MTRKHLLWLVPLVFGLNACASVPRPTASEACAEWQWIGIKSPQEEECPGIPGWKTRPLFSPAADLSKTYYGHERATPAPEVVQELERFCVYEATSGQVSSPPTAGTKLVRIDKDCAVVSRASGLGKAAGWQVLSDHFLAQAGKPKESLAIQNRFGVRLTFLDTHPTGEGAPLAPPQGEGTSEHGYTLAHIARNLICSPETGETCAAQIATRLALPIVRFDPKSQEGTLISEQGGHMGLQSHLAGAIMSEVDTWLQKREANPSEQQHLVLNLSVAWDGRLLGDLDEEQIDDMRAGTQAVYWALRYAAGFDALVLAAAGNRRDCPKQTEGPLLPAAWETGAPDGGSDRAASEGPLLYAVGGVDTEGKPLANARDGAMPRRVAYGENAVVPSLRGCESTSMYTGSSVSTAVVSSIAAIAWDTVPGLDSGELMELLDKSGDPLTRPASFWFGRSAASSDAPEIHRLSLCASLNAACAREEAVNCPLRAQATCKPWKPAKAPFPDFAAFFRKSACHPWMLPQPDDPPCPNCYPPRLQAQ